MATFRSSTSSSSAFVRDVVVALLVLAACEVYLGRSLAIFAPRGGDEPAAEATAAARPAGFQVIDREDPLTFFDDLSRELSSAPVVFVGDSQGAVARGGGAAYPEQALVSLRAADDATAVIRLHLGGANAYEQGALLLAMVEAGIRPRLVVWSHSIFSLRKNQIRGELVPTYRSIAGIMDPIAANVTLAGAAAGSGDGHPATGGVRGVVVALAGRWDAVLARSASVSFMRRPLWDKGQILRRSELGRLVPTSLLGGTARQFDPPTSILRDAARVVGGVSRILVDGGACVVNFIAPIDRDVMPRPFTRRAEAVAYPALAEASRDAGAVFADLLDAMPHEHFGRYEDGTPDAFHFDVDGHALLAGVLLERAREGCQGSGP